MKSAKKSMTSVLCADKLRVLADVTRLSVMETLLDGPKNVTEINAQLKIDQSLLSHHLKVLREAGLVTNRREGKSVRYAVSPDAAATVAGKGLNLGCCEINFVQFKPKR
jgi:DNA-binding transcriptional ArsR family regulator